LHIASVCIREHRAGTQDIRSIITSRILHHYLVEKLSNFKKCAHLTEGVLLQYLVSQFRFTWANWNLWNEEVRTKQNSVCWKCGWLAYVCA